MYSRVKLFVYAMNSGRRYCIFVRFIYGLEEKNSKSEVIFVVFRLPLTSCLTSLIATLISILNMLNGAANLSLVLPVARERRKEGGPLKRGRQGICQDVAMATRHVIGSIVLSGCVMVFFL